MLPSAHVEKANTELGEYERKSGLFLCSEDTHEIRQVRFGILRENQKKIIETVDTQNDRQIDVYIDPRGDKGKTFLTIHLWERGLACVVPRSQGTAEKISAFVCSAYKGQPYVIIDIPRAGKIRPELYEAIEELKDGLVSDCRYHGRNRNIRGARIIVFTNKPLDTKKLTKDRWRLHGMKELEEQQ